MKDEPPKKLFGTSEIIGQIDDFLTAELSVNGGLTFAATLQNKGAVLIGRDVRKSSHLIQNALISVFPIPLLYNS